MSLFFGGEDWEMIFWEMAGVNIGSESSESAMFPQGKCLVVRSINRSMVTVIQLFKPNRFASNRSVGRHQEDLHIISYYDDDLFKKTSVFHSIETPRSWQFTVVKVLWWKNCYRTGWDPIMVSLTGTRFVYGSMDLLVIKRHYAWWWIPVIWIL